MKTEFKFGEVINLASQIEYNPSSVNFKNIFDTKDGGVSLLAMTEGQKLDTHVSPFGVMVCVVEGEIEFTMLDNPHIIHAGEFLLMGEEVPHSVVARKNSKLMLTKVKIKADPGE